MLWLPSSERKKGNNCLPAIIQCATEWKPYIVFSILKIDFEVYKHCQSNSEVQKGF